MKNHTLILLCLLFATSMSSCNEIKSNKSATANNELVAQTVEGKRPIKYFPIKDSQRNLLMALLPIPSDWEKSKADNNEVFLESPKGIKVSYTKGNEFLYSYNDYINQSFQQMGYETKPVESFEQILSTFKGLLTPHGLKLIRQYDMPQLQQADADFDRLMFKGVPEQKTHRVVATEWNDGKGNSSLAVIHYYVARSEMSLYWGYIIESLDAPDAHFSEAKRDYLNALINVRINPVWINKVNAQNREQSQQIEASHQRNMGALRAQGEQIIANGKQHDVMTSRNHQKFIDGINDRITVTSPSSGQSYDVAMGNNHYWINDNNELITSDNANYNPNADLNVQGSWEEADINY